jgi:hypothetical protein
MQDVSYGEEQQKTQNLIFNIIKGIH